MEAEDSHLEAMGLHSKRGTLDELVGFSKWPRKQDLHNLVLAQTGTTDRPDAEEWFRTEKGTSSTGAVRCNVCIYIIKIQATVIKGNTDNSDNRLQDEYYLCKQETGAWAVENLVTSGGTHKKATHLKHAANPDTYSVPKYYEYIPINVISSAKKYIQLFFTKHKPRNQKLTKAMCTASFVSFKCDLEMDEEGYIEEHFREVHNIPGVAAMKPLQLIEVDAKQDFSIPDLSDLEILGPDKQAAKIDSIYVRSVARGMLITSSNKSSADLVASKSQDFLLELGKRTNKNFFKRFEMNLSNLLEKDITTDFSCKWDKIEKSLFKAMSAEQSSVRYAKFLETNYTAFHSLPMELIIDNVEKYIDNTLGKSTAVTKDSKDRSICDFVYNIRKKYDLIFDIAKHLSNDFKIIREYIIQLCTKMHDKEQEYMDITAFQEHLAVTFETKGVLLQFRNDNIPAHKKQNVSVAETKIKKEKNDKNGVYEVVEETPELKKAYNAEIKKFKIDYKEDNALKERVDSLALDIGKDTSNDDLQIIKNEKIQALLSKEKKKICWKCRRQNCVSAQVCSRRLKLKKKFVGKCDGKPITFKELRNLKEAEEKSTTPDANGSTAKISPKAVIDSDSDGEFNSYINTINQNNSDDFGYDYVQNSAEFSILGVVTEDNIPNYAAMKETEFIADKSCIICPEEDMDLEALSDHYCYEHTITFTETYEDDLETFQRLARTNPGESRFYAKFNSQSSCEDQEISDFEALFDLPPRDKSGSSSEGSSSSKKSKSQENKSGSSSDSSSSIKSSRSRGNKKSKSRGSRDLESLKTQVMSQKNLFENEISSSQKQMASINKKISENQIKEEIENKKINAGIERINAQVTSNKNFFENGLSSSVEQMTAINDKMSENQTKQEIDNKNITSGIENINTSLVTIASNQSALENALASNTAAFKEKEEKDRKKNNRTLQYLSEYDARLSKLEKILQASQEGQTPIINCVTPIQIEPEVIRVSNAVQKTQVNSADSATEPQLKQVPEPDKNQSDVSMNTIKSQNISGKKVNQLKKQRYKLKMLKVKKENKKNIPEEKKEQVPQNFLSLLFNFLTHFTNSTFSLLNNITSSPTGIVWGILIFLAIFAHKGLAAESNGGSIIHHSPTNLFLANSNSTITQWKSADYNQNSTNDEQMRFFPTHHMEANSIITHLGEIEHNEQFGITSACDAIHAQHNICLAHPDSCEANQKSIANYEETIKIHSENLHLLENICEPSEVDTETTIDNCHNKKKWEFNSQRANLSSQFSKFTKEYLQSSAKSLSQAKSSKINLTEISSDGLKTSDLRQLIKDLLTKNHKNISSEALEEMIDVSLENTKSTSTLTPLSGTSRACNNMLLIKTSVTPIIRLDSMKKAELTNEKLMIINDDLQSHILLPNQEVNYNLQSGQTKRFTGRDCIMDKSITARSIYSPGSLAETIRIQTVRDMSINMSCTRHKPSNISTWFIKAGSHQLNLPIDCSIISSGINCSSVTFSSTMTGVGTGGKKSSSYFNLSAPDLKTLNTSSSEIFEKHLFKANTLKSNRALINQIIWPIIGLVLTITIIASLGWLYFIMKIQGRKLQVIKTTMDESSTFAPSCPMESEIRDLPIYSNSELMGFLDFPNETRTMIDSGNIVMQMERMLTMESEQTSQSRIH